MARARDLAALLELKAQLDRALAGGRYASTAFELLRGQARARRMKLEDLGREVVEELEAQIGSRT
jgi:hypothetical protein